MMFSRNQLKMQNYLPVFPVQKVAAERCPQTFTHNDSYAKRKKTDFGLVPKITSMTYPNSRMFPKLSQLYYLGYDTNPYTYYAE